jgi:hypothetical protein
MVSHKVGGATLWFLYAFVMKSFFSTMNDGGIILWWNVIVNEKKSIKCMDIKQSTL